MKTAKLTIKIKVLKRYLLLVKNQRYLLQVKDQSIKNNSKNIQARYWQKKKTKLMTSVLFIILVFKE